MQRHLAIGEGVKILDLKNRGWRGGVQRTPSCQFKEPRSPICLFLFGSCFLNQKWLFETLKEDVNPLQIVSGQEYID